MNRIILISALLIIPALAHGESPATLRARQIPLNTIYTTSRQEGMQQVPSGPMPLYDGAGPAAAWKCVVRFVESGKAGAEANWTIAGKVSSPSEPATQPAADAGPRATDAVQVNDLDFQILAPPVWQTVNDEAGTTIPLALKVTNRTDKPVTFDRSRGVSLTLKDAAGKVVPISPAQQTGALAVVAATTIEKGQSITMDCSARLKPVEGKVGQFLLFGADGGGGAWVYEGLVPGKYSLSMVYENAGAGGGAWVGKATTKALAVELR